MKKIEIIIRPTQLDAVKEALAGIGIHGMTCMDVRGFGRQGGHTEVYRGATYKVDFVPKVRVEVVVDDALCDKAVEVVMGAARTGQIGDGKIFVSAVENAWRIRTGESGDAAV